MGNYPRPGYAHIMGHNYGHTRVGASKIVRGDPAEPPIPVGVSPKGHNC